MTEHFEHPESISKSELFKKDGLLRLPAVLSLVPVSKATWYNGIKEGRFPTPVKIGPRTSAWRAADILNLIDNLN